MTTSHGTPSTVVDNPVTERVVKELERRGFGSPVAGWIAHSIEAHGLQYTVEALAMTLYDIQTTAEVDQHNHQVMNLAWSTIGSKAKNSHLPQ